MRAKQAGKGPVQDVEPAGQDTEGRQNQPCPIADESPAAHRASVAAHLGGGMQMAGHFAVGSVLLWFMAQGQAVGEDDIGACPGQVGRQGYLPRSGWGCLSKVLPSSSSCPACNSRIEGRAFP